MLSKELEEKRKAYHIVCIDSLGTVVAKADSSREMAKYLLDSKLITRCTVNTAARAIMKSRKKDNATYKGYQFIAYFGDLTRKEFLSEAHKLKAGRSLTN